MNWRIRIAFCCYLLVGLVYMAFGAVYFFSSRLMPYHEAVLPVKWNTLDQRIQVMFVS